MPPAVVLGTCGGTRGHYESSRWLVGQRGLEGIFLGVEGGGKRLGPRSGEAVELGATF